ncbi:MAG: arylamine N-acetyltransferase, partial [Anderseniella sp.]
ADTRQSPYTLTVTEEDDGWFRFSEQLAGAEPDSFDYTLEPVGGTQFGDISQSLQTDPNSSFRRMLKAQRRYPDRHVILRGCVKKTIGSRCTSEQVLTSDQALVDCLYDDFGLDVPDVASVWPAIARRHEELFG